MKKSLIIFTFLLMTYIYAADRDGDGLTDAEEKNLGSNPDAGEVFQVILLDGRESASTRRKKRYEASKDVVSVENAHAGDNRFLWRVNLTEPPNLQDTVLHLYVDADANTQTGRKGSPKSPSTGTDYMVSVVKGKGYYNQYGSDGKIIARGPVSFCVNGKSIILSADINLKCHEGNAEYALYVLCHAIGTGSKMSDMTKKLPVKIPLVNRKKIMRLTDMIKPFGTQKDLWVGHYSCGFTG